MWLSEKNVNDLNGQRKKERQGKRCKNGGGVIGKRPLGSIMQKPTEGRELHAGVARNAQ